MPSNYGPRRLPVELQEEDHRVDRHVLLMGLCRYRRRTLQPKAFTPRTNVFDLWPAVRPEFAARPAAPHPGQPVLGERHHVFALGQWAYLCAFQDGRIKHVAGWQVRADIP